MNTTAVNSMEFAKYLLPAAITAALLLTVLNFTAITGHSIAEGASQTASGISYKSAVCKMVTRTDGSLEHLGCDSNLFTDLGRNITRDALGLDIGSAVNQIALANDTGTVITPEDLFLDNEYNATCGLARQSGTYSSTDTTPGNWSLQATFTSTCNDVTVNATGLLNDSVTGDCPSSGAGNCLFAQDNFTTTVLQTNDQITITWFVWVTEG